jgi:hypothetical protein
MAVLIKALAYSRKPGSAQRAEELIQQMHDLTKSGTINTPPDIRTYTSLVMCHGMSGEKGSPQRAEAIIRHIDMLHQTGHMNEGPTLNTFQMLRMAWETSNEPNKTEAIALVDQEIKRRFGISSGSSSSSRNVSRSSVASVNK